MVIGTSEVHDADGKVLRTDVDDRPSLRYRVHGNGSDFDTGLHGGRHNGINRQMNCPPSPVRFIHERACDIQFVVLNEGRGHIRSPRLEKCIGHTPANQK